MKSTVAAAAALTLAFAATTVSAGVVISQHEVVSDQAGQHKSDQTVMVQGNKKKVISGDEVTITDLDEGKVYFVRPKAKQFVKVPFPPFGIMARVMARKGAFVGFKKTDATNKVAGYTCQDYTGGEPVGFEILNVTECVASDAPGAKEFVDFHKAMALKLKGTALDSKAEVPDGIPVSSTSTLTLPPYKAPRGMPPEQLKQVQDAMAKRKPIVIKVTVSKIEVKDLPADTFVVPADYGQREVEPPAMAIPGKVPGLRPMVPPAVPAAPGSSTGAPATH